MTHAASKRKGIEDCGDECWWKRKIRKEMRTCGERMKKDTRQDQEADENDENVLEGKPPWRQRDRPREKTSLWTTVV